MDQKVLEHIKAKLSLVPLKPGCYQMYNKDGVIIYVGKAKLLANRLKSYFTGSHDAKTTQMVSEVVNFEYIITRSETEAFLLEHNFIKEYRPHYNILLMDDKTYPYICLTNETHPRLIVTRDVKLGKRKNSGKLFGPYPNVTACRDTCEILNKVYPFRKCNQIPKKHCLYYDMGQCLAPCENKVTKEDYESYITSVSKFLNGNDTILLDLLKQKMELASENLEFEKAIEYRNIITSITSLMEKQTMTLNDGKTRDIFGFYVANETVCVQVLHMRSGRIIERSGEVFDVVDNLDDLLVSYIYTFYDSKEVIVPSEILTPYIEGINIISELLNVKTFVPIRGIKKKLVDLVCENAKNNLDNLDKLRLIKLSKTKEPLIELSNILNISYPKVIELFDNSNIQGASPISAMVTYIDGIKSPKDYRKYNVKTVVGADDYHTMQEVLTRRYTRVIKDNLRKPNLVIVDGGRIQVKAAKEVFKNLSITDIYIMGLEKDDRHRTRAIVTQDLVEIEIDKHSNLFLLLEAMQDEVHRFAITFFKETHAKNTFSSILDEIEGIGKRRKMALLKAFNSMEEMASASVEKLLSIGLPKKVAEDLLIKLNTKE